MDVTLRCITESDKDCAEVEQEYQRNQGRESPKVELQDTTEYHSTLIQFGAMTRTYVPAMNALVRKMYPLVLKLSYQKCYLFYDQWPEKSCYDWPTDLPLPVEKQDDLCEPCRARVLIKELEGEN